jgi:Carboxypeptidase regulatory-like domain
MAKRKPRLLVTIVATALVAALLPAPALAAGFRIGGAVTDIVGSPLAGIVVSAFTISGPTSGNVAFTAGDGSYSVGRLVAGSYRVQFSDPTKAHLGGYYATMGYTFDPAAASPVVIGSADVTGINIKLLGPTIAAAYHISGAVTDMVGTPLAGIVVSTFTINGPASSNVVFTASDGSYSVARLVAGSYRVQFADPTGAHPSA